MSSGHKPKCPAGTVAHVVLLLHATRSSHYFSISSETGYRRKSTFSFLSRWSHPCDNTAAHRTLRVPGCEPMIKVREPAC